jgi:DICT domain-containing protein
VPEGTLPASAEPVKIDVKQLVDDVFKETRQALTPDDPIMIAAFVNQRLLEGMAHQVATVAGTAAANAADRQVRIMLAKHKADLGGMANEISEMIEENILAAAKDGAALVSGAVQGSAQAVGQRTLDQIDQFSRVVRRVEYLVYGTWAGLAVLVAGIAIGRFV